MAYRSDTGISAQKLAGALYRHVRRMRTVQPGEIVNKGLDGGREFGFLAKSRDGRELFVSVVEDKPSDVQAPRRASQAERIAIARQKRHLEAEKRRLESQERRRVKWLGGARV